MTKDYILVHENVESASTMFKKAHSFERPFKIPIMRSVQNSRRTARMVEGSLLVFTWHVMVEGSTQILRDLVTELEIEPENFLKAIEILAPVRGIKETLDFLRVRVPTAAEEVAINTHRSKSVYRQPAP